MLLVTDRHTVTVVVLIVVAVVFVNVKIRNYYFFMERLFVEKKLARCEKNYLKEIEIYLN